MPLIVVVLPDVHELGPEEAGAPPLSATIRLPVPAATNKGPALPALPPLPPALGVWVAPALACTPLPGLLEFPQAIEPSNAMPVHKENGMVFMSKLLRSIGGHTEPLAEQLTHECPRPT